MQSYCSNRHHALLNDDTDALLLTCDADSIAKDSSHFIGFIVVTILKDSFQLGIIVAAREILQGLEFFPDSVI